MSLRQFLTTTFSARRAQRTRHLFGSEPLLPAVERLVYREHLVENATGNTDDWKAKVNQQVISGDLDSLKERIDRWCDKQVAVKPGSKHFGSAAFTRQIVIHRGFKIINDTGESNGWYMLHRGQLFKGTRVAIEQRINQALARAQYA
ncbi:DUF3319 domain-containing protein [Photobacterium atrarenae]|uniref:DUF3319 domain-containing protein n=1 Tax=Photobacterium atrarenae TaxID=865757 RepID=A0ABY5GKV8_9GAMM|nr:DUF3319 domain-containing protein [Photobacterium atrarenae]UTV28948.1 DUF3319 domain-containing protein [Photobacterium atrarenae]